MVAENKWSGPILEDTETQKVLLHFQAMGLGDHVQFGIVLEHLVRAFPDWHIGALGRIGAYHCFSGIAHDTYEMVHPYDWMNEYPTKYEINFPSYPDGQWAPVGLPSTKVTRCLVEQFKVMPIPELYRYSFPEDDYGQEMADRYIEEELPAKPFEVVHYRGVSHPQDKNMTDDEAKECCELITARGHTPVILDWQGWNCPLANNETIFHPAHDHWLWENQIAPDCTIIAGLLRRAHHMIGIDSGPEHLAAAVGCPLTVRWVNHHPLRCFDPGNALHVMPEELQEMLPKSHREYFHDTYEVEYF